MRPLFLTILCCLNLGIISAQDTPVFPGADEKSPSRAQYFSWINNCNEGTTEEQTLLNLAFFKWLKEEYGMNLDIYAFDAGAIDGKGFYGSTESSRFKRQFPNHFLPIFKEAKSQGIRLGIWGGPDGFGDTPAEEEARIEQMVSLARDYNFELFKFDGVCGELRKEKQEAFVEMMTKVRVHSPDLILLDHRLDLGIGKPHATTSLWEGAETYIDVHMANNTTAPHHRAGALDRGHTPNYTRLTEDHGVCISSCLDRWDDELIMQAFNRNLILAPQIYGNPWFLRDDEYYRLARIFNLHRKHRDILVNATALPDSYGPNAVSRGTGTQRFISMTNLSWEPKLITIKLDSEIGLEEGEQIELRKYHPTERILGNFAYGQIVDVEVLPFRSILLYAGIPLKEDFKIYNIDYLTVKETDTEYEIKLLGDPLSYKDGGMISTVDFSEIILEGKTKRLSQMKKLDAFKGRILRNHYHRKLDRFRAIAVNEDAPVLYEATVFSTDNNALEVRSIKRSGYSDNPIVKKAQDAFFQQATFIEKGGWDDYLFDKDLNTSFAVNERWKVEQRVKGGCLRLDFAQVVEMDVLKIIVENKEYLQPLQIGDENWIEISTDLINWTRIPYDVGLTSDISITQPLRYVRMMNASKRIQELSAFKGEFELKSDLWKASNLFAHGSKMKAKKMWKQVFRPIEIPKGSYLCIALEGKHGIEGAYAAAKIDGKFYGCPDRAVSYPSNTWEYANAKRDANYTYYMPLTEDMRKKEIEIYVMAYDDEALDFVPTLYITTDEIPFQEASLILKK